ncbi:hypothetical protein [Pseudonocardia sp. TMWB2A]|uniref:hypothetical protein n=1 Tax=Pseudonocardia sp. TMWB2A TaxID=687430 RepID=UPI00307E5275
MIENVRRALLHVAKKLGYFPGKVSSEELQETATSYVVLEQLGSEDGTVSKNFARRIKSQALAEPESFFKPSLSE